MKEALQEVLEAEMARALGGQAPTNAAAPHCYSLRAPFDP